MRVLCVAVLCSMLAWAQYSPPGGGGGGGGTDNVQGASNLTVAGCVGYQSGVNGKITCNSAYAWDGTNLNVPGPIKTPASGTGAIDLFCGTTPTSPSTGYVSAFCNSANSNHVSLVNASGTVTDLQAVAGAVTSVGGVSGTVPGGWILQEQHAASASSELDFTSCISSTYDVYAIQLINLVAATNAVHLVLQFSTNGGTSYDTGSNYSWSAFRFTSSATAVAGAGSQPSININGGSTTVAGVSGAVSGAFSVFNPGSSTVGKQVIGSSIANDGAGYGSSWIGTYGTSAINSFRVLFDSGNIASGTVRCYGVAKQ